jgi:carbamoyl-phosphate synthase large subunit
VIEVNPRASRTVPFVSKCIGESLAKIAARCQTGKSLEEQGFTEERVPDFMNVKEAVFPFNKFPSVDPILGPEMKSTGEVMGTGVNFAEAFAKAQTGSGAALPSEGTAFLSVRDFDKDGIVLVAKELVDLGFKIVATRGTAKVIGEAGIDVKEVNKVAEGRPHAVDMIKNKEIQLIINTTEGKQATQDSASIRRSAEANHVYYTTTLAAGNALCMALRFGQSEDVRSLQELHGLVSKK